MSKFFPVWVQSWYFEVEPSDDWHHNDSEGDFFGSEIIKLCVN